MIEMLVEKIKFLLEENNLSVQALEKKAGLKANAVYNLISGNIKKPKLQTVQSLSQALSCSFEDLVDDRVELDKLTFTRRSTLSIDDKKSLGKIISLIAISLDNHEGHVSLGAVYRLVDELYFSKTCIKDGKLDIKHVMDRVSLLLASSEN
jgi:transcriptional regulator with XRE-family HTH domain